MSEAEPIIARLNELKTLIHNSQMNLGQGKVTGLSHLDSEVSKLCERVLQLPTAEAKKIQPIMADMIGNLDTLALSLKSFQAELKEKTR